MIVSAAAVAGACSDDEGGPGSPAVGGEGGEPEAAGGMSGNPSGGSIQLGGAAGESGGESGAAGMPPLPSAGEVCAACGATECTAELDACTESPECAPWLTCLTACDDAACVDACDAQYADVARVYYGVYTCLCDSCEEACAVGGACDKQCVDDEPLAPTNVIPGTLADTGLFVGGEGGAGGAGGAPGGVLGSGALELAPNVYSFEPKYPLWSDGAAKDRYIYIPRCSTIDTTDMDHWRFPVGTRLWKHFTVGANSAAQRVETRMLHRHGPGEADWLYAAYQWDISAPDDPSMAISVPAGVINANGTMHDIPGLGQCTNCHDKLSEKVLGFGAFQLSHAGQGLTIERISNLGWLTTPAPEGFEVPGTPVQQAALGYLHGNCGGCHNSNGQLPPADPMLLRLLVGKTDYAQTDTVLTTVGVSTVHPNVALSGKPRIDPMMPANSTILLRMQNRTTFPMPPIASKAPDTDGGVAAVTAWVNSIQ
ncbi:MAG TPA: hypothetical protein VJN18_07350 [Polyangiaceae bacterium]|nr:hypothetical protein [Polyangiaceae bacterium]